MKTVIIALTLFSIISCKKTGQLETTPSTPIEIQEITPSTDPADSLYFINETIREQERKTQLLKNEGLTTLEKVSPTLQEVVEPKTMHRETDDYLLDYTYPYLNEQINPSNKTFNDHITQNYLHTERTINEILEGNEMICDTLNMNRFRDKRIINYKLHNIKNDLVSILLYKENYYSGMLHATYMFDCINYNMKDQEFIYFDTFFIEGSEKMVLDVINSTIYDNMQAGDTYHECWKLLEADFARFKDHFIISGEHISFYLDDCIICPSHTGAYKVLVASSQLQQLIRSTHKSILY
jgi:hypothetical protein